MTEAQPVLFPLFLNEPKFLLCAQPVALPRRDERCLGTNGGPPTWESGACVPSPPFLMLCDFEEATRPFQTSVALGLPIVALLPNPELWLWKGTGLVYCEGLGTQKPTGALAPSLRKVRAGQVAEAHVFSQCLLQVSREGMRVDRGTTVAWSH